MDKQAPEIFKLNAAYQVAPGATSPQLLEDATCLMGIVHDSLSALALSIDMAGNESPSIADDRRLSQLLWGLSYLAEMGNAAAGAAHTLVLVARQESSHE